MTVGFNYRKIYKILTNIIGYQKLNTLSAYVNKLSDQKKWEYVSQLDSMR